jgi:hypothetical protein
VRSVRLLAAAVAVGASAVTAACGQQHGPGAAASPSDPPSSAAAAPSGCHGAVPERSLTLGSADNGRSFCLARGGTVLVTLRGTAGRIWTPIRARPAVLVPRADGRLALARWVTGASFAAVQPGTAVLSSARPACRMPASRGAGSSSAGVAPCLALLAFRVTVTVAGG